MSVEPGAGTREEAYAGLPEGPEPHPIDLWISRVLRGGVLVASVFILLGLLAFVSHLSMSGGPSSVSDLVHMKAQSVSVSSISNGVKDGQHGSIIRIGILLLILTPVSRVALSAALFAAQRDWTFLVLTCFVLAILALGLFGVVS